MSFLFLMYSINEVSIALLTLLFSVAATSFSSSSTDLSILIEYGIFAINIFFFKGT